MGFSTGEWQGTVLKVYTTHLKQGWHRRNGVPMSAKATMTEYSFRHGTILTQMTITEDPVFLTEPLVKTTNLQLNPNAGANQYQAWLFCQADDEVPGTGSRYVPHFLPGARTRTSPSLPRSTICRWNRPAAAPRRRIRSMRRR